MIGFTGDKCNYVELKVDDDDDDGDNNNNDDDDSVDDNLAGASRFREELEVVPYA